MEELGEWGDVAPPPPREVVDAFDVGPVVDDARLLLFSPAAAGRPP